MTLPTRPSATLTSVSIVVNPYSEPERWLAHLQTLLPDDELHAWPETGDPDAVEFVIGWRLPRATVRSFVNLRYVLSLSAGAEQWLVDGMPDVPVVRLEDPSMSDEMAAYSLYWVMHHQRSFDRALDHQRAREWREPASVPAWEHRVGILGFGLIGARIARAFSDLGYPVRGWSRTGRRGEIGVQYAGADQLASFLGDSDSVINVLPSTGQTRHVLDAARLDQFTEGSLLVNIGRGATVDEAALVAALDDGPIDAAVLDVTDPEPPDEDSPLWDHPRVTLTPHVAGRTRLETAATLVVENIERIRNGDAPFPLLDRGRGY